MYLGVFPDVHVVDSFGESRDVVVIVLDDDVDHSLGRHPPTGHGVVGGYHGHGVPRGLLAVEARTQRNDSRVRIDTKDSAAAGLEAIGDASVVAGVDNLV